MENAVAHTSPEASVIKAYWQPGCTSCLRMKEFLTKHGVSFVSINVLEDTAAIAELADARHQISSDRAPWQRLGERPGAARGGARRRRRVGRGASAPRARACRAGSSRSRRQRSGSLRKSRRTRSPACCRIDRAATRSSPITSSTSPTPSSSTRSSACRSRKVPTIVSRHRR